MRRRRCNSWSAGIQRAMRRCGKGWGAGLRAKHPCAHGLGHRAVVRAVTTAASRQTRVVVGCASGRERAKAEEENEEDGEEAPHLQTMLHEVVPVRIGNDIGCGASGIIDAMRNSDCI